MTRILILGGTAWLGREIAEQLVSRGDEVSCLARGESGAAVAGARFIPADRDDEDGLKAVARERWDAVIDVSRQPGQVRRAVRDLRDSAQLYIFVSSKNAYAEQRSIGQDEDAPLLPPLAAEVMESMESYGEAKVACEQAVLEGFGQNRSLIARAGLIGGPGDTFGRTGYWPLRFAHPATPDGTVLVPLAPNLTSSIIDVRDLAAWLILAAETGIHGTFNATGDVHNFDDHLAIAREVAGHTAPIFAAAPEWLRERGVEEWAGERSLPLWLDDADWLGMNARSNERAKSAGLALRPLAETLADTLAWEESVGVDRPRRAGLSASDEAALVAELVAELARG